MNTLGEWFRKAFPLDEKPKGGAYGQDLQGFTVRATEEIAANLDIDWPYTPLVPPALTEAVKKRVLSRIQPTLDEFQAWRDDPVTQFVMRALERNAEECREKWLAHSWDAGDADPKLLIAMRERHDALMGFTSHYDDFCAVLGLAPQEAERAA